MGKLKYLLITEFPKSLDLKKIYKEEKFNSLILSNLKRHSSKIFKITLLSILSSILALLLSTQLGQFIDLVIPSANTINIYFFATVYIILLLLYVFSLILKI